MKKKPDAKSVRKSTSEESVVSKKSDGQAGQSTSKSPSKKLVVSKNSEVEEDVATVPLKGRSASRTPSIVFKPKHRVEVDEDIKRKLDDYDDVSPKAKKPPKRKKLLRQCSSCEVRVGSRHVPRCPKFLGPILHEKHPLPDKPTRCQRFMHSFYCPPRNTTATFFLVLLLFLMTWGMLYGFIKDDATPGKIAFFLLLLEFIGLVVGFVIGLINLPPLLGMLIVGMLLGNLLIDYKGTLKQRTFWYPLFRNTALSIILTRAGLGLNPTALRRLSFVVFRLAFTPCLVECATIAITSHFLLDLPWLWGFLLGFALAAVSPAVVVPGMINLQRNNIGVKKGLPTLVIAAASIDDVLAIGGFGIILTFIFSHDELWRTFLQGPMEVAVGLVFGIIVGLILWFIPDPLGSHVSSLRVVYLFLGGLFALLMAPRINLSGAGALGCIILAFVSAYSWRLDTTSSGLAHVSLHYTRLWRVFEPLLFGLVGSEIILRDIIFGDLRYLALGLCTLGIGLFTRLITAFLVVYGCGFDCKERLFIALAWIPKATVQAAIGPYVLDYLNSNSADEAYKTDNNFSMAVTIRNLTAIAILLSAPLGAGFIAFLPKLLLKKDTVLDDEMEEVSVRPMMRTESESHMFKEFLLKAEPHHASISKLIVDSSKSSVVSKKS